MEEDKDHKKNAHQIALQGGRKVTYDFYQNQVKRISSNLMPEKLFKIYKIYGVTVSKMLDIKQQKAMTIVRQWEIIERTKCEIYGSSSFLPTVIVRVCCEKGEIMRRDGSAWTWSLLG